MGDVLRLNNIHEELLKKYYDLLVKRYGSDCPVMPKSNNFSSIISSALLDAISYNNWLLNDSEV